MRDSSRSPWRTLVFPHLLKTGGLTLRAIIRRNYGPASVYEIPGLDVAKSMENFFSWPARRRKKIKVFMGHMVGMAYKARPYLNPPAAYITLLRDPIDRTISSYYYFLREPKLPEYRIIRANRWSLKDCITHGLFQDNLQTRDLSGMYSPCHPRSPEMLAAAKRNLRRHFAAYGLTERFNESLVLFKTVLGWGKIHYRRMNVTADRPGKRDIPKDALKAIEAHNELDIELYRHAKERFDKRLSRRKAVFRRELAILDFLESHIDSGKI